MSFSIILHHLFNLLWVVYVYMHAVYACVSGTRQEVDAVRCLLATHCFCAVYSCLCVCAPSLAFAYPLEGQMSSLLVFTPVLSSGLLLYSEFAVLERLASHRPLGSHLSPSSATVTEVCRAWLLHGY